MLRMSPQQELKLAHMKQLLDDEFDATPASRIAYDVEAETKRLLPEAHFDDYIPILVYRSVREHLLDEAALTPTGIGFERLDVGESPFPKHPRYG